MKLKTIFTLLIALFAAEAKADDPSGVDTFVTAVTQGCLPAIANNTSIETFVKEHKGGPMPPPNAAFFLAGKKGEAYVLPHPEHQFVVTVFAEASACSIFVRRIDRTDAEKKLDKALKELGFTINNPKEEKRGLYTTGYTQTISGKTLEAATSYSIKSEGNFHAVATVYLPTTLSH